MKRTQVTSTRAAARSGWRPGPWFMLFVTALALRALVVILEGGAGGSPGEAADHDQIAWNLATGHGFSLGTGPAFTPTALRAPLVPWITSLLYRAAGHHVVGALLLQCVIGALLPLFTALFGAAVFGGSVGLLAGWLIAFHPLLLFQAGSLGSETTFALLLLLALLATVEWIKTPRPGRALGVGITWGVAGLASDAALPLPFLVALWAWVPLGLTVIPGDRIRQVLLLLLGMALAVGPWTIRNAGALHAFVPITTSVGRAFLDASRDEVDTRAAAGAGSESGTAEGVAPAPSSSELESGTVSPVAGLDEPHADALAWRLGLRALGEPGNRWTSRLVSRLATFWGVPHRGASRDPSTSELRAFRLPFALWSMAMLPFAVWGLVRILRGPRRWFQSLGAFVILYFNLVALVLGHALRSRTAAEPLIMLLGALGLTDARRRLRARASGLKVVQGSG